MDCFSLPPFPFLRRFLPSPMMRKSSSTATLAIFPANSSSTSLTLTDLKVSLLGLDFAAMYSSKVMVLSGSSSSTCSTSSAFLSSTSWPSGALAASWPSTTAPSARLASFLSDPQLRAPPPPFLVSLPRPVPERRSYARLPSRVAWRAPRPPLVLRSLLGLWRLPSSFFLAGWVGAAADFLPASFFLGWVALGLAPSSPESSRAAKKFPAGIVKVWEARSGVRER
mmetsp:Transcript_1772/g.5176  ORF Transcript_1772/g.5176 Transcript_1772/m.5176 type:complete len:225 (+) Transcript_1772:561-1235(+)